LPEPAHKPSELVLPTSSADAPAHPDAIEPAPASESVTRPTKLIRIAAMLRTMLDEVRRAPIDEDGRRMLKEIHTRSVHELEEVLSPDLIAELDEVVLPFESDVPTESELRLAQAQLVGWLEGLFHGIQATLFTQQSQMASQLEEMRAQRMIGKGGDVPSGGAYL